MAKQQAGLLSVVALFQLGCNPSTAIYKKLSQITFVSSREEAEVWLQVSAERDTERDSSPGPNIDSRPSETIIQILRSQGKIIRLAGSNPARLVKKFFGDG